MSDSISTEKISDYINVLFKKHNIFQKIDKFKYYTWSFMLFSSIIGVVNIYINYKNLNIIQNLYNRINENEKCLNQIKAILIASSKPESTENNNDDIIKNSISTSSLSNSTDSDEIPFIPIQSNIIKKEIENFEDNDCILL